MAPEVEHLLAQGRAIRAAKHVIAAEVDHLVVDLQGRFPDHEASIRATLEGAAARLLADHDDRVRRAREDGHGR